MGSDRSLTLALQMEISDYLAGLKRAGQGLGDFGRELDGMGRKAPRQLDEVAFAAAGLGTALLAVAGYAVKAAATFDKQMSSLKAATRASAAEMELLRKAALEAGAATTFSATDAARAQEALAKAGVSVTNILGGGLKGALDLAAAGSIDVGAAAEIAASAMTQFGLSGKQVPHVADLLAAAAGKAQGTVHDMGLALSQSGLVAAQFGLSLDDTVGTLASFASAGLLGSDAGTSFKTMLLALAAPSEKAAATMKQLGINAYDAQGKFIGISGLAEQLRTKLGGLTEAQRNAALATIFGTDAIRAANVLYNQGAAGVDEWRRKVSDAGYASETAATKTDNLAGDLERLRGSLETLAIQSGSGTNTGLRSLVKALDSVAQSFAALPGPVQQSVVVLAAVGGTGLIAAAGLLKARQTAMEAMEALRAMGPAGEKAAAGLGAVGKAAGWATLIFAAYMGLKAFYDWAENKSKPTARNIDEVTNALQQLAATGRVAGELAKMFGQDLSKLTKGAQELAETTAKVNKILAEAPKEIHGGWGAQGADDMFGARRRAAQEAAKDIGKSAEQLKSDLAATDKALAAMATSGGATQAKLAYEQLAAAWVKSGGDLKVLKDMLPEYQKAQEGAAFAASGAAKGFGDVASNAQTMAASMQEAISKGQSLIDVFNQLNGAAIGVARAEIAADEAIDNLSESLAKNGLTLDTNTAAGRSNLGYLVQSFEAAGKAAQAKYEETGSVADAEAEYYRYIASLRETLRQAGFTEAQINQLINTYGKMPKFVTTTVELRGVENAMDGVSEVHREMRRLNGTTATVTVRYQVLGSENSGSTSVSPQRWGGVTPIHAARGLLSQAGVFNGGSRPLYAFAERETMQEAFIPRRGNAGRSLAILSQAARWYGHALVPASGFGRGGGGPAAGGAGGNNYTISVYPPVGSNPAEIGAEIVAYVKQYEGANGTTWRDG